MRYITVLLLLAGCDFSSYQQKKPNEYKYTIACRDGLEYNTSNGVSVIRFDENGKVIPCRKEQ